MSIRKVSGETIIAAFGGGYALQGSLATADFNPTSNMNYYGGDSLDTLPSTSVQSRRIYIPKTGTIKTCYGFFAQVAQAVGSLGELNINVENGAYTLISTASHSTTASLYSNTGLSIAVTQGNYIEFKWRCPVYPPTKVLCEFVVYIE